MPDAGPLIEAATLEDFPGGPFDQLSVLAAGGAIRGACGWHIAPSVEVTVELNGLGTVLVLPALQVTEVSLVEDITDPEAPVEITDYRWSSAGLLTRAVGWPCGLRTVRVTFDSGYESAPPELLAVVAALSKSMTRSPGLRTKTVGGVTYTYGSPTSAPDLLAPYAALLSRYRAT